MIIDSAAYVDGGRVDIDPTTKDCPDGLLARLDDDDVTSLPDWHRDNGFAWVGLSMPTVEELAAWCDALQVSVDPNDILTPHARPVLTMDAGTAHLVLRTVHYDDAKEIAVLGEMTVVATPHAMITIRHGQQSQLSEIRAGLERDPARLRLGVTAAVAAVIGRVIDDYGPALDGFETDAVEVDDEVFTDSRRQPVQRLYQLKRELRRMLVAIEALEDPIERLIRMLGPSLSREVMSDLNENADQLRRTIKRGHSLSNLLDATLTASLTQVTVQQNDDMRKISAWVAMAAVPTLVAGIYGMNFDTMPELGWRLGYPFALGLMAVIVVLLYRNFKRSGWL